MSDIFEEMFGDFMGGGGAAAAAQSARLRGSDLRYNLEITLEEAFTGRTVEIDVPTLVDLQDLRRLGRQARHRRLDLPHLQRPRQGARGAGLLHHRAHLPGLPGPRPDDGPALHRLRRPGPAPAEPQALGRHPQGHRGRHPHPARQRGRGRRCAAARRAISTSSSRSSRTTSSSATAPTSTRACRSP